MNSPLSLVSQGNCTKAEDQHLLASLVSEGVRNSLQFNPGLPQFGSVTVRWWNGLSGSGFRSSSCFGEGNFPVFQYRLLERDGSSSGFGF